MAQGLPFSIMRPMLDFSIFTSWLPDWLGWLQVPWHDGPPDAINEADFWHGLLMMLGGGVLVPVAVLAARYWKIMPGQDWPRVINHKAWQIVHLLGGTTALLCMVGGVTLVFHGMSLSEHLDHPHAWAGWGVMVMLLLLVLNTALKGSTGGPGKRKARTLVHLHDVPGDHYDMTLRRRVFEWGHRVLGWGLLFALIATILTGYWHVNVGRGLVLVSALWWVLLGWLALRWEREGRAVDGYQARWGPSMGHPGNRIPLLAGGHRRYSEEEYQRLPWGGRLIRERLKRTTRQRRAERLKTRAARLAAEQEALQAEAWAEPFEITRGIRVMDEEEFDTLIGNFPPDELEDGDDWLDDADADAGGDADVHAGGDAGAGGGDVNAGSDVDAGGDVGAGLGAGGDGQVRADETPAAGTWAEAGVGAGAGVAAGMGSDAAASAAGSSGVGAAGDAGADAGVDAGASAGVHVDAGIGTGAGAAAGKPVAEAAGTDASAGPAGRVADLPAQPLVNDLAGAAESAGSAANVSTARNGAAEADAHMDAKTDVDANVDMALGVATGAVDAETKAAADALKALAPKRGRWRRRRKAG